MRARAAQFATHAGSSPARTRSMQKSHFMTTPTFFSEYRAASYGVSPWPG